MRRDALKFEDLGVFLSVASDMGHGNELSNLIYEQGKLPYCSAFLIPTDLLPDSFDLTKLPLFSGTITQIEEIRFLGNERFTTDFMVYPLSLRGYVELETYTTAPLNQNATIDDLEGRTMNFVINLEDASGTEFYLAHTGDLISLADPTPVEPQVFKTTKQVNKQTELLRQSNTENCRIYALDRLEFDARRNLLLAK